MANQGDLYAALFAAPAGDDDGPRGTVHREEITGLWRASDRAAELGGDLGDRTRLHFYRCRDCLAVVAISERPEGLKCGACGGVPEFMGTAGKDPKRLTRTHTESVCNDQCTSARGPHCECACGGRNHGTRRHVVIVRDVGAAPTVSPPTAREVATCRARAEEYRGAQAEAREAMAWAWGLLERKQGGEYLSGADFGRLLSGKRLIREFYAAENGRTHKGRLAKLARLVERARG